MQKKQHWNWQGHLTPSERVIIRKARKAKAVWLKLNLPVAGITNRAVHRAKFRGDRARRKKG